MSEEIMTNERYAEAYRLNAQICTSIQAVQQSAYEMFRALKQMRDGKLYKELGYQNFEEYCENEAGISRRHAYRYISIYEKLPEDFVTSCHKIGVQKLYLLTALTDDQREEITQTVDLENTTVRELKMKLAQAEKSNELLTEQVSEAEQKAADAKKSEMKALGRVSVLETDAGFQRQKIEQLEAQVGEQADQIKELESRPVEVAVPEPSREVQNMQDAMRRLNLEHEQWSAKIQDDHIKQVQEINRQHRAETDALRAEYEEKLAAAQASPTEAPEPDSKEIFKAYLANAIDATKRMMAFLAAYPNETCRAQAERFFSTAMKEVQA